MNKKFARNVNGILLLDKPVGITSNKALQKVKALFLARKAGHTGSLDPLASGMLPICFGEATKFSQFLLEADKIYTVTAKLGVATETGDAEGEIISEKPIPKLSKGNIKKLFKKFQGEIEQVPSMYSALKYNGEPLYKLARQGITVERPARPVTIYALDLIDLGSDYISFQVHCSKGTYVRTLVEDMGNEIGCGAHVSELRRLQVGHFVEQKMVKLDHLEELVEKRDFITLNNLLIPLTQILDGYPSVEILEPMAHYLRQGQAIVVPKAPTSGLVLLKLKGGCFIGVGEVLDDGKIGPKRLLK